MANALQDALRAGDAAAIDAALCTFDDPRLLLTTANRFVPPRALRELEHRFYAVAPSPAAHFAARQRDRIRLGEWPWTDAMDLTRFERVRQVTIAGARSLAPLRRLPRLSSLTLEDAGEVEWPKGLAVPHLTLEGDTSLDLRVVPRLRSLRLRRLLPRMLSGLNSLRGLRLLDAAGSTSLRDLPIDSMIQLVELDTRNSEHALRSVSRLPPSLRVLAARSSCTPLLADVPLRQLSLHGDVEQPLICRTLEALTLARATPRAALDLPRVEKLSLTECSELSFDGWKLPSLRRLVLDRCEGLRTLEGLPVTHLEDLEVYRCHELSDLGPLSAARSLRRVRVLECSDLRDASPVLHAEELELRQTAVDLRTLPRARPRPDPPPAPKLKGEPRRHLSAIRKLLRAKSPAAAQEVVELALALDDEVTEALLDGVSHHDGVLHPGGVVAKARAAHRARVTLGLVARSPRAAFLRASIERLNVDASVAVDLVFDGFDSLTTVRLEGAGTGEVHLPRCQALELRALTQPITVHAPVLGSLDVRECKAPLNVIAPKLEVLRLLESEPETNALFDVVRPRELETDATCELPSSVESLVLREPRRIPRSLRQLDNLERLRHLDLAVQQVRNIDTLTHLELLETLVLPWSSERHELDMLGSLPRSLRRLHLRFWPLHGDELAPLVAFELEELVLEEMRLAAANLPPALETITRTIPP